jgi:uncharacterized membrane protein
MVDNMESKNSQLCAILSYLLIGIVWYFVDDNMKKDEYVKYHVKQSIILILFAIIWSIILQIISSILFFLGPLIAILNYIPMIFAIIGIINALNFKKNELPIIGNYASKLTF